MKLFLKILKYIGIGIGGFLGIGFFLPGTVHMERQTVIGAPAEIVYSQINELHNWNNWSPWAKIDPNTKYTFSQPITAGEGAYFNWYSNNKKVGNGKFTILSTQPNKLIHARTDFEQGFSYSDFKFTAKDTAHTNIIWTFDMDFGLNPILRWVGLSLPNLVSPDYDRGLANLKSVCEITK